MCMLHVFQIFVCDYITVSFLLLYMPRSLSRLDAQKSTLS